MLLEFKVANYRSIREEQILSFIGTENSTDLPPNFVVPKLAGMDDSKVLKVIAIYGANASGKSNILLALRFLTQFAARSFTRLQPESATGTRSFRLESAYQEQATTFEISAIVEGERYTYGLSLTPARVTEEYLVAFPKGDPKICFERKWNAAQNFYEWSPPNDFFHYETALREATRDNCSFVSTGAQFKHTILAPLQRWFASRSNLIRPSPSILMRDNTARAFLEEGENVREAVLAFIRGADFGIRDLVVEEPHEVEDSGEAGEAAVEAIPRRARALSRYDINFRHQSREGLSDLGYADQSSGTQRYFALAAAWIQTLLAGGLILMDEIETSLHPILVRALIQILLSGESNPKNAQLIFTTHNPLLLDRTLLRMDQIWFTEKDGTGATTLYPLTDYQQRSGEPLINGYLAGRYGGVPFIPAGLLSK